MLRFAPEPLGRASAQILEAAGAPEDVARRIAGWLVNANLSGHPSHGVIRITQYVQQTIDGIYVPDALPEVVAETDTTVLIDGRRGFGHLAAEALTRAVAKKAKSTRVAIGGIRNCNHIGRLGEWSELAAELDVVFFMTAGGPGMMRTAPFGGAEGRMSTNPMTFAAPAAGDDEPMIMDFATTASAEGKIRVARDKGVSIPEGQILDKEGRPSVDPNDLYAGGVMLPFGAHKGYGFLLMAEILASNLTGAVEPEIPINRLGVFAFAIGPDAFGDGQAYHEATSATFGRMRNTRPAEGFSEVLIPGDMERKSRAEVRAAGIELPEATWNDVLATAERTGLDREEIARVAGVG